MPTFIHKQTGEIVQAVRLRKPLPHAGRKVDLEQSAWAGDWFVVGSEHQGWLSEAEFLESHRPLMEDPPLGAVVRDPSDGEILGEVREVMFDAKGTMTVRF